MDIQSTAMEQMSQAYAKGKPDMMEWRALQTAMPGQLKQIAKAMNKTTTQLGEDLRSGKVSMNDFMKTVTKLNKTGIKGFQSFEQQAKNSTGGIQTSLANMKSAITRGLQGMIENANSALEASGLPKIQDIIVNIGKGLETLLNNIGSDLIPELMSMIQELTNAIDSIFYSSQDSATKTLTIWNYFMIGFKALILGIDVAVTGFIVGVMALCLVLVGIAQILYAVFGALVIGIETVLTGALILVQEFANKFIDIINGLVTAINKIFKTDIGTVDRLTFADSAVEGLKNASETYVKNLEGFSEKEGEIYKAMQDVTERGKERFSEKATGVVEYVNKIQGTDLEKKTTKQTSAMDPSKWKLDNIVGTDSSGGKALKTTTKDNLLSDEDIQLLLDVATRDYKLNYQQVTPNITLTFGDIRESVDVDDVLDEVADKLQEIYDGNLEVG